MARTIKVDYLARVEGEGALTIRFRGNQPASVELRIFEPPRFFEGFLRGRSPLETPDITARICGICPVAYQMSACRAVESALGIEVGPAIDTLRRLLYCGEWIESHALHVFMLHAPDFLGYPDAIRMAADHRDLVVKGLAIKKAGNALMARIGGREIHPVNVRVGGFYRAPTRDELGELLPGLRTARDDMLECLERFARFDFPELCRRPELVALSHPEEYPMHRGRIVSSAGLDIDVADYAEHFVEEQVPHSTALHARLRARGPYLCGPLARFGTSFERLRPLARQAAERIGLVPPVNNPFRSLLVRSVEIVQALDEAVAIIESYERPDPAFVSAPLRAGSGHGATEAPRGLLYHRYRIGDDGLLVEAQIVPPTSQNQKSMEQDLFEIAPQLAELPHADATWRAEQVIRNHDPCISCATHFLKLAIERAPAVSGLIVAMGQRVAGDDGVGLAVLDALRARALGPELELRELRDASELLELLDRDRPIVVLDALLDAVPGSVRVLDPSVLCRQPPSAVSSHGLSLRQAVELARALGHAGAERLRVVAVGIEAPRTYRAGLSPAVAGAVERAADTALAELER